MIEPKEERQLIAYTAAILLAPVNASRQGHGILNEERSIAVREARYLIEEILAQMKAEPIPRH